MRILGLPVDRAQKYLGISQVLGMRAGYDLPSQDVCCPSVPALGMKDLDAGLQRLSMERLANPV